MPSIHDSAPPASSVLVPTALVCLCTHPRCPWRVGLRAWGCSVRATLIGVHWCHIMDLIGGSQVTDELFSKSLFVICISSLTKHLLTSFAHFYWIHCFLIFEFWFFWHRSPLLDTSCKYFHFICGLSFLSFNSIIHRA